MGIYLNVPQEIHMHVDKVQWPVLLNTVIYLGVPCNARNLLTKGINIRFSRRDFLHEVGDVKQSLENMF